MAVLSGSASRRAWVAAACALACAALVSAARAATYEEECGEQCADLVVSKEATDEIVGIGERFSYHLAVENDGPADAAAVELTDTLPDGVTYVSAESEALQCTHSDGRLVCTTPVLPVDEIAEVELVVEAPNEVGTIVNEAVVTSETQESALFDNTTSVDTQVGTDADLLVYSISDEAAPGDPVHFYLSVVNDGPQSAHGVSLIDTLPAGAAFVSAAPTQGACSAPAGRELKCSLGTVAAFELVEVELVVSGIAEGVLRNIVSVEALAPFDPDVANNRDAYTAVIGTPALADLAVYQDGVSEIAGAGERFTYLLSVENEGPAKASGATLTDELPDGVTYVPADGLPCSETAGVVTCAVGELEAGDGVEVALEVQVSGQVARLANEAMVTAETADVDSSNNTSSLETPVGTGADLELAAYGTHAGEGEPVQFFVSVWNEGPQSAHGVVVEDVLPAGVELVSATPSAGSCEPPSQQRFTCSIGTLTPFDEVEIEIVVSGMTAELLTNLASVESTGPADPELANNEGSYTAVIGDPPVTDVAVYADAAPFAAVGDDLVYAVRVENVGPEVARDVRITGRLPLSVAFVAATLPCAHDGGTVTCDVGDLGVDDSADVTITVRPQTIGRVVSTVEAAALGGPADFVPESNSSTAETDVGVPPASIDDSYVVNEDETLSVPAPGVLGNDTVPDSAAVTAMLVGGARHGWLSIRPDGSFRYFPQPNFSGSDSFAYRAADGARTSHRTVVTITVAAVNDRPVALDDTYHVEEDGTLTATSTDGVLTNDTDVEGSPLTTTLGSAPANGTIALSADGSFTYVPRRDFHGSDAFTYEANDGELNSSEATVKITVAEGPAPPPPPPSGPPPNPRYLLTVTKGGSGTGTVTGRPGIDCGADCVEEYDASAVVTLLGSAASGSRFVAWAGACSGAATSCTVTMDAAKSVTATFAKIVVKPRKVVKTTICFRKRTLKVPKSQVAKYKKRGAKLGPCKKPRRKRR